MAVRWQTKTVLRRAFVRIGTAPAPSHWSMIGGTKPTRDATDFAYKLVHRAPHAVGFSRIASTAHGMSTTKMASRSARGGKARCHASCTQPRATG